MLDAKGIQQSSAEEENTRQLEFSTRVVHFCRLHTCRYTHRKLDPFKISSLSPADEAHEWGCMPSGFLKSRCSSKIQSLMPSDRCVQASYCHRYQFSHEMESCFCFDSFWFAWVCLLFLLCRFLATRVAGPRLLAVSGVCSVWSCCLQNCYHFELPLSCIVSTNHVSSCRTFLETFLKHSKYVDQKETSPCSLLPPHKGFRTWFIKQMFEGVTDVIIHLQCPSDTCEKG